MKSSAAETAAQVTVEEIMQMPTFVGARVLAGSDGIARAVRSVTVADVPRITDWLSGDDFVHCVGKLFIEDGRRISDDRIAVWARSLCDAGASCIAVKIGRFVSEVPQALLKVGDAYAVPVIELPESLTQGEVTGCVLRAVQRKAEEAERRATAAFAELCSMMVGPHSLDEVATKLAGFLDNPVLVENDDLEFMAASKPGSEREAGALSTRRSRVELDRLRLELPRTGIRAIDAHGDVPAQCIACVPGRSERIGYLSVLVCNRALTDADMHLLETCVGAFAIDMGQREMAHSAMFQARGRFFSTLTSTPFSKIEAARAADMIGFDYRGEYCVVVIAPQGSRDALTPQDSKYGLFGNKAVKAADSFLRGYGSEGEQVFVCACDRGIAVIGERSFRDIDEIEGLVRLLLKSITLADPSRTVIAGVGGFGEGITGIRRSALEAFDVLKCISDFALTDEVVSYNRLGRYALLASLLRDVEGARSYCLGILSQIIDHDRREGSEFLRTLEAYLKYNGGNTDAATELIVHVNTVKYRMGRIRELLPIEIDSFDGRCAVWLALKLYRHLDWDDETSPS